MEIAANLISFIGCVLMVLTGLIKKKENILWVQCVQFMFMGAAHLLLGAISGFVCCVVSILRNVAFAKFPSTGLMKAGFILLQIVLTFFSGNFAPIEILPILAAVVFTWFLDLKNSVHFNIMLICAQAMWVGYDFYYGNVVAGSFDVMTILSNVVGIFLIGRDDKKKDHTN